VGVYRATKTLPADERFGLTAQLRRAAVSILANIAEGAKRTHRSDYAHFLNIAEASLAELQCLLILCEDLGYMSRVQQELRQESARTAVMLDAFASGGVEGFGNFPNLATISTGLQQFNNSTIQHFNLPQSAGTHLPFAHCLSASILSARRTESGLVERSAVTTAAVSRGKRPARAS